MNNIYIISPLEQFEINNFIGINAPILGYFQITLTNIGFYFIVALCLSIGIHIITNNNKAIIANKWSISQESIYVSIHSMVREQIGVKNEIYFPFIFSLFSLVLFSNLIGMVPYSFTPTSHLVVCISLSFAILLGVTIIGFQNHGIKFFSFFVPAGTPIFLVPLLVIIELISYLARGFSLGIRLAANITAGHTLLKIIATFIYKIMIAGPLFVIIGLIPLSLLTGLSALELGIAILQSYVFTILACSYIKDAIDLH